MVHDMIRTYYDGENPLEPQMTSTGGRDGRYPLFAERGCARSAVSAALILTLLINTKAMASKARAASRLNRKFRSYRRAARVAARARPSEKLALESYWFHVKVETINFYNGVQPPFVSVFHI
jgi:hypothetical protein